MDKKLILLPYDIEEGAYIWEPISIDDAKMMIEHLKRSIANKDSRMHILEKELSVVRKENDLLYDRIEELKSFIDKIGVRII